jgi:outer membrane protein OmpA-like peptidoglycan-associated protein
VIFNRGEHFLKSGFTAKLLTGIYNVGITAKGVYGQTTTNDSGKEGINFSEGNLNLRHFGSENIQKINPFTYTWADLAKIKVGNGFGFDLGFAYEFRPDYKSSFVKRRTRSRAKGTHANEISPIKYKFKVALALTDFGKINYKHDSIQSYSIDLKDKKFGAEIDGKFQYQNLFALTQTKKEDFVSSFTASIPTTLQLNADYRVEGDFFLNLSAQQNLLSRSTIGARSASYAALTPRLERKHYEIALPFAFVNNYKNFIVGTAFRIGPLMIGTDNLLGISGLFKSTNGTNIYAGLHLGFQDKKITAPLIARKAPAKIPKGQRIPAKIPTEYDENGDEIPNTLSNGKAKVMAKSAEKEKPAPKKPLVPTSIDNIERFDKCITFFYEKNTLMSSTYTCLGEMCKYYTKNKNIKLRITGCMLELEKSTEPEKLKISRARAIRNYLIQSGFPASQISIVADKNPNNKQTIIFQKVE